MTKNFREEVRFMKNHDFKDQQIIEYLEAHSQFRGDPKEFVESVEIDEPKIEVE